MKGKKVNNRRPVKKYDRVDAEPCLLPFFQSFNLPFLSPGAFAGAGSFLSPGAGAGAGAVLSPGAGAFAGSTFGPGINVPINIGRIGGYGPGGLGPGYGGGGLGGPGYVVGGGMGALRAPVMMRGFY